MSYLFAKMIPQTHLAFLPTHKGEVHVSFLLTPVTPGPGIADNDVLVEAGVEVHRDVLGIVTDVECKAAAKAGTGKKRAKKREEARRRELVLSPRYFLLMKI